MITTLHKNQFTINIHVLLIYRPLADETQERVTEKYSLSPYDELWNA